MLGPLTSLLPYKSTGIIPMLFKNSMVVGGVGAAPTLQFSNFATPPSRPKASWILLQANRTYLIDKRQNP